MKVVVIGDEETVSILVPLGAIGVVVKNDEEMYRELVRMAKREDVGLIILSKKFSSKIRDKINKFRLKHPLPLLLEVSCKANMMLTQMI